MIARIMAVCLLVLGFACVAFPATTRQSAPAGPATPISVVVSIPPLKGIVAELGKDLKIEVQTLIPVGVSEHGYEIPASKFRALAKADIIVYVGRGLEPGLVKYLNDHPATADAARGVGSVERVEFSSLVTDQPVRPDEPQAPGADARDHDHGDHDHAGHEHDPHIWLDPLNMKKLVPAVRGAIERVLKSRGEYSIQAKQSLDEAESGLLKRIEDLHERYEKTLASAKTRTIVVAHDAYGLLACRYDLRVVAIAGLHASEPTMKDVKRAIDSIRSKDASVVYVEPQLSRSAGERVAKATGARVLVLDPVGGDDWFETMKKNLESLASGLGATLADDAQTEQPGKP
ncbi:MAG: metal ABC transporter substrate-binding protein [Phycisphaerales bacterium]